MSFMHLQYEDGIINFKTFLDTLMLTYNHDTIHKWLYTNFMHRREKLLKNENFEKAISANKKETFIENIMKDCIINGFAEFCQISALLILKGNNASIGCLHSTILMEQSTDTRGFLNTFL